MTKIFFIAFYFPPHGGAGVQRSQKFVRYLPDQEILPTVITAPLSADLQWAPVDETLSSEVPSSVQVHRVRPMPAITTSKMQRRLAAWLARPSEFGRWWVPEVVDAGINAFSGEQAIFATMSPFESAEAAGILSRRLRIPWVADLRDPWALDEMMVYPSALHRQKEISRMARFLSSASAIVMNTNAAAEALRTRIPSLASKRIVTITNGYDDSDFAEPVKQRTDNHFRIVHSGSLHSTGGLALQGSWLKRALGGAQAGLNILTRSHHVLLRAMSRWVDSRPEVRNTVELVFAGKVSKDDQAIADASPVASMIRFTGYVPHHESTEMIRTADLLFLPMHSLPPGVPSLIVPGKTYEYAASGRPILAAVPDGDVHQILSQCGTGLVCRPEDEAAMAAALDRAYTTWKKEGRVNAAPLQAETVKRYERRALTFELAELLKSVIAKT
jgi:glycosyltransferase involved in cell wall biosynthesis